MVRQYHAADTDWQESYSSQSFPSFRQPSFSFLTEPNLASDLYSSQGWSEDYDNQAAPLGYAPIESSAEDQACSGQHEYGLQVFQHTEESASHESRPPSRDASAVLPGDEFGDLPSHST